MSAAVIRSIACAGALATGLLLGGAGTAYADPVDATGSTDDGSTTSDVETPSGSAEPDEGSATGGSPGDGRPTSTIGNGRNDVADRTGAPGVDGLNNVRPSRKFSPTLRIPVLRIPTAAEFRAPGFTPPTAYIGTAEIPIPTISDVLRAFGQPEPEPEPPGPAFRTQQEEAPVADATGNGGGGSDRAAAADTPPVFRAPIVVAPRLPAAPGPRPAPSGPPVGAPNVPAGGPPAVAGVRTPLIRGTLPPSGTMPVTRPLNPATGQTAPAGYPRYLRTPTAGELAMVALPGVAGLMFLTVSGGVIGYRQANSSRYVRSAAVARFLP